MHTYVHSPPQSAASFVSVTLSDAATNIMILVMRLLSSGVMARLSAEPPSAKGTVFAVKLIGLQYLSVYADNSPDGY
jgi:hypothetical protein